MRAKLVVAAVIITITATACASGKGSGVVPPPFYRPNVSLRDVKVGGVGITGGSLNVLINVYNPNQYELATPRVAYRVYVDDEPIARGIFDADVVLQSLDSVKLRLPASFTYLALGQAGRALLNTGTVNYRIVGNITVGTPYGRYTFPYDRAGWFSSLSAADR